MCGNYSVAEGIYGILRCILFVSRDQFFFFFFFFFRLQNMLQKPETYFMAEEHAVSIPSNYRPSGFPNQMFCFCKPKRSSPFIRLLLTRLCTTVLCARSAHQATVARFMDLISQPPTTGKYKALKTRLLDTFGLSAQEWASRLLHFRTLGDSKPSALMDEMLALLGDHPPCFLFKQLSLERLPEDVRVHLAGAQFTDCRQLAKKADTYWVSRDTGFSANPFNKEHLAGRSLKRSLFPLSLPKCVTTIAPTGRQLANADHPVTDHDT